MAKKSKEVRSSNRQMAGSDPGLSSMVGGVSNAAANTSSKKSGARAAFAKGGKVSGMEQGVNMGGFRNAAMEHKR